MSRELQSLLIQRLLKPVSIGQTLTTPKFRFTKRRLNVPNICLLHFLLAMQAQRRGTVTERTTVV